MHNHPFEEGHRAYLEDFSIDENPYDFFHEYEDWSEWAGGWLQAEQEAIDFHQNVVLGVA